MSAGDLVLAWKKRLSRRKVMTGKPKGRTESALKLMDLSPSPPRTPWRAAPSPSTPKRSPKRSVGLCGGRSDENLQGSGAQASCSSTCTPEKVRESPQRLRSFGSLGAEEANGPRQLRRVLSLCDEDDETSYVTKMRALKRARTGECQSAAEAEPSPEAALLIERVLSRSSSAKVVTMLRERIAAGRKVHGQLFTLKHVEEAVLHFRSTSAGKGGGGGVKDATKDGSGQIGSRQADKDKGALQPFRSKSQPLAYQGSYMPPAAVSRLVGDEICAICLDPLREQAQTIAMCGHIFHRHCLNDAGSIRCPTCRRPVDLGRASVQELKSLVLSTRAVGSTCSNLLELSRKELLDDCNRRRRDGNPLFTPEDLNHALGELVEEAKSSLIVEEDSVVLLL